MDIGTAKPDAELLRRAPHRLIDIRDPTEPYSAADFCADAKREIEIILAKGRIPLLVGGTMLYFRALQKGLAVLPAADPSVREQLEKKAETQGWLALHAELKKIDPLSAARIHPNDPQRIQRALEVYALTGKPISALLPSDRADLHKKIECRFDQMLTQGFLDEVKTLYARGDLNLSMPSIRAVGYQQAWGYLAGEYGFEQFREKAIIATRQLAKRQMTWLRTWPQTHYFSVPDAQLLDSILTHLQTLD
jgi:tRNA dimethylallyltransferase